MNRVWDIQELRGGPLLVMLALADHANDAGECWPSQEHLAARARLDVRQVRRVIGSLVKDGYLKIAERRADHGRKTKYRLFPESPDKMSGRQKADILSGQTKDKMSGGKRTFSVDLTGHFGTDRPDISDTIPSHARSESPLDPKDESSGNRVASLSDSWATCLEELQRTQPGAYISFLEGSRPELNDDGSLCRIILARADAPLAVLKAQLTSAIRFRLGSILHRRFELEIVATELEKEPMP